VNLLVQDPVVVDVIKQPPVAHDISIDAILTMFASAGVLLLVAGLGGIIVGLVFVGIRRMQEKSAPAEPESSHVKLRI
jgi:hypothetical protein